MFLLGYKSTLHSLSYKSFSSTSTCIHFFLGSPDILNADIVIDLAGLISFWISIHMPYFRLQLKEKIEKLEKANLAQKPWQMSGEAGGNIRPINSLLEEDVSFDHTTTTGKKMYTS